MLTVAGVVKTHARESHPLRCIKNGSVIGKEGKMAYSGVLDDVKTCINLGIPNKHPIFALSEEFDVGIAGFTYEQYCSSVENIVKVHNHAVEKFDFDWVNIYIADSLDFEPLGVVAGGEGNIPPSIKQALPAEYDTLKKLKLTDPQKDGRLPMLLEAISRVKDKWGEKLIVSGRAPAPFSAVTLLYGMTESMMLLYDNPQLFIDTAKFFEEHQAIIAKAQIEAGADALWVGDCSASSRFIPTDLYKKYALEPATKLMDEIRNAGGLSFYYTAEPKVEHLEVMIKTKPDVIALPEEADLLEVKNQIGNKICLMGNIDPIKTMLRSTPEEVAKQAKWIKNNISKKGGHLFNTGEGLPRETPEENIFKMINALRED